MTAKDQGETSGDEQQLIRQLAELLNETGLSEIEIEKSGLKVRVARTVNVQSTVRGRAGCMLPLPAAAAAPGSAADPAKHPGVVKSPMVGTAYRSPEPGAPAFIEVGSQRRAGRHAVHHRSHEDHEPDPRPARRQGHGDPYRERPAGRVRRAARHHRIRRA